jgi:hypothetical protein
MNLMGKFRYFTYGSIAAAALIPLAIKAIDVIPWKVKDGDVISASMFNTVFKDINDTARGFSSAKEMAGVWSCEHRSLFISSSNFPGVGVQCPAGVLASGGQYATVKYTMLVECVEADCTLTYPVSPCTLSAPISKVPLNVTESNLFVSPVPTPQMVTYSGILLEYRRLSPTDLIVRESTYPWSRCTRNS